MGGCVFYHTPDPHDLPPVSVAPTGYPLQGALGHRTSIARRRTDASRPHPATDRFPGFSKNLPQPLKFIMVLPLFLCQPTAPPPSRTAASTPAAATPLRALMMPTRAPGRLCRRFSSSSYHPPLPTQPCSAFVAPSLTKTTDEAEVCDEVMIV